MSETENTGARRRVLAMSVCAIGGIGAGAFGAAMLGSLRPSRSSLAASLESFRQIVDVSALKPGESKQVELVGRPVTLFRRTQEQLRDLERFESDIVDPTSRESLQPDFAKNRFRSMDPELLVVQPICTHLPCTVDYIRRVVLTWATSGAAGSTALVIALLLTWRVASTKGCRHL